MATPGVIVTGGKSDDNLANLSRSYKRNVIERYRGTRLGRQELDAEILDNVPGALWSRRSLRTRRGWNCMRRCWSASLSAVDPAVSSGEAANENGIIVCGLANGVAYVLEDWSLRGTPDEWARKAVAAWRKHEADAIVAEANQGGEMVAQVIRSVLPEAPVKLVRATRRQICAGRAGVGAV